jgi:hypothetical protein
MPRAPATVNTDQTGSNADGRYHFKSRTAPAQYKQAVSTMSWVIPMPLGLVCAATETSILSLNKQKEKCTN